MTTLRNASLVLKTSEFAINTSNSFGFCDSVKARITWNNINLRSLLGDMYDAYDTFNLCLNTIATEKAGVIDAPNQNLYVRISGLPWVNQCYNVKSACNGSSTILGSFNYLTGAPQAQYYYSNNIATFAKNQDICNITIEFVRISDDTLGAPSGQIAYPNTIIIFDIFGIPKSEYA